MSTWMDDAIDAIGDGPPPLYPPLPIEFMDFMPPPPPRLFESSRSRCSSFDFSRIFCLASRSCVYIKNKNDIYLIIEMN